MKKGYALVLVLLLGAICLSHPQSPEKTQASPQAQSPLTSAPSAPIMAPQSYYAAERAVVDGPVHDGQELTVDLDPAQQFKNIGSLIDQAGMCVFSAVEMAALAQGLEQMRGFRDWWASVSRGGGWPEQVDKSLAAWWKHRNIAPIPYYQYEGTEPEKILNVIDKTGRMACLTYGFGERYISQGNPSGRINHMVNSPGFRRYGIILDNNFPAKPGNETYEWMSRDELCRRAKLSGGKAWIFVWLTPPPPPPVRNAHRKT